MEELVERLYHLNVTVKIDPAIIIKRIQADIISRESVFLRLEGLLGPWRGINVETLCVPKHNLVIRKVFFP